MRAIPCTACVTTILIAMPSVTAQRSEADREQILEQRDDDLFDAQLDLEERLEEAGGLDAIRTALVPLREEVARVFASPVNQQGRVTRVGRHFFNRNISPAAIRHDWHRGYGEGDPVGVIIDFHHALAPQGIDLIVVPVPSKIEACYGEFETPLPARSIVSPGRTEAMLTLMEAGVEVVDMLPTLFDAQEEQELPVYETSGHHPSGLAVKLCGERVAERLLRYPFATRDTTRFEARRRTGTERIDAGVSMKVWEVRLDDDRYEHVPDSPVVIIGDSNAFAYGAASFACHIARAAGLPVTDLSTSSGASTAHAKLAQQGLERLRIREVVIWIITSSQLERFPWSKTQLFEEPTLEGLLDAGDALRFVALYHRQREQGELRSTLAEDALDELARGLLARGEAGTALQVCEIACREHRWSADAFTALAEAAEAAGQPEPSAEACRQALNLNPAAPLRTRVLGCIQRQGLEVEVPEPLVLSDAQLQRLRGSYRLSPPARGNVRVENGALVYEHIGQSTATLRPVTELVFGSSSVLLIFEPQDDGMGMTLHAAGRKWSGTRDSSR